MRLLLQILLNAVALLLAAHLVPGISYHGGWLDLFFAGIVIGIVNGLVRPVVAFFSLPLIIVTLGLFYLVISGLMLQLADFLLAGLRVDGCLPAILGAMVIGIFNWAVGGLFLREERR